MIVSVQKRAGEDVNLKIKIKEIVIIVFTIFIVMIKQAIMHF